MLQIDHGFPRYFGWAVAMLLLVISVAILPQQEFTLSPKADYARVNSPGALPGIAFSDMIGALQRERFNTLLFTLMPTPEHRASLLDARLRTDTALDLFDDVIRRTATGNMSDQAADQIDEVMLRFSSLTRQRRQLDRLKLSWRDGFASYSTFIISVLDLSQALDVDKHASLTTSLRGWLPFTFLGDTAATTTIEDNASVSIDMVKELGHLQSNIFDHLAESEVALRGDDLGQKDAAVRTFKIIRLHVGVLEDLETRILSDIIPLPEVRENGSSICRSPLCSLLTTDVL